MRVLAAFLALCTLAGASSAASTPNRSQERVERTEAELRDARARWEALTDEERDELRARFDKFRQFDPARRDELRERAHRFKEIGRQLRKHGLPPELERELDGLPPDERRRRMGDWLHERFEERGRRIREKMPEDLVQRLERAPPGRRGAMAEGFRRDRRGEHSEELIDKLARSGHLPRERVDALRALPVEERVDILMDLRREKITADIVRRGLPPGITAEQWGQWQRLPTREFFEHFHRAVGPPPGPRGADSERARAWFEIRRLMNPQNGAELEERDRLRVLELLTGMEGVAPEQLQKLRALQAAEFRRAVRDLVRARLEREARHPPRPPGELDRPRRRDGPPPRGAPRDRKPPKQRRDLRQARADLGRSG